MEQFLDFVVRNWMLFAILAVLIAWLIGGEVLKMVRGTSSLNASRALAAFNDENGVFLDIREVPEFRDGHLPEARNIPLGNLKERTSELERFKDRPIIVYCRTGQRSDGACATLRKDGFEKVHSLTGGFSAWQGANLPVTKGRK